MSYIGQSGRSGHVRIYEHGRVLKNSNENSVLYQHFKTTGHTFDLKNPTILDVEISQSKESFQKCFTLTQPIPLLIEKQISIN